MRLFLSYQESYKPNNINSNKNLIIPKQTNNNNPITPDNKLLYFKSIFERLKHTEKCNSCNGAR